MLWFRVAALAMVAALGGWAADPDFTGAWKLDSERSHVRGLPTPPPQDLKIEHAGRWVRCDDGWAFTIDGKSNKAQTPVGKLDTVAKWEGSALLVNAIVSGAQGTYTLMDRWKLSSDGTRLTIQREIVRRGGNLEVTLLYQKEGAAAAETAAAEVKPATTAEAKPAEYVIGRGTKIPLVLINSVSTKQSAEGDHVYLETSYPIMSSGRIVIPAGSYVAGTVTHVKKPGRVRGRGELFLRFDTLTLPNGVTRDFRGRVGALDGESNSELDRAEGTVKSPGNKGGDAQTVGEAAGAGASVGAIAGSVAGHAGMGVGIGAAAGAAAGLMGVLLSRGPDAMLTKGSSLEMVLDRPLAFKESELKFESVPQVRIIQPQPQQQQQRRPIGRFPL